MAALSILLFFIFFSYSGLFAYFTFDDGTGIVASLKIFETPLWRDLLHIALVFTSAFRPLTAMFWRPLYAMFGFNPLPYRIAEQLLMMVNIGVAYLLARRLEVKREGAALTALVFSYNASMADLLYNTCVICDIMCFFLYGLAFSVYIRGRESGDPLRWKRAAAVIALYMLALDSKEHAVTLPAVLVLYELFYRRGDFRDAWKTRRVCILPALMFAMAALYLKVKVADMSRNSAYHPNVTIASMLNNLGHYVRELLYLPENALQPATACLILVALCAAGALVRSRQAIFGVLFFVTSLLPVTVIAGRGTYAAYVSYFGLALAAGAILSAARSQLVRLTKREDLETPTAVVLFVCIFVLLGWAHMVRRVTANGYFEWDKPRLVALMDYLREAVPEFPPNARVLITEKVWGPDYGLMALVRLMYHDNTIWVDRPNTMDHPPDLASYDLVASYLPPDIDLSPMRFHRFLMKWEIRGTPSGSGQFEYSSPGAHGKASHIGFAPRRVSSGQSTTITVPCLSNVAVNVLYRIVSDTKSTVYQVKNWCTLDAQGSCNVTAPSAGGRGAMFVDWIQPVDQRWIRSSGFLTIVE